MVALSTLAVAIFLFAANSSRQNKAGNGSSEARRQGKLETDPEFSPEKRKGRNRYGSSGKKTLPRTNNRDNSPSRQRQARGGGIGSSSSTPKSTKLECIPPAPTGPKGPWPTYFTCRHTYEDTLMEEIQREVSMRQLSTDKAKIVLDSPSPGLVRVDDPSGLLLNHYDPVYALQAIPDAVVVKSDSIKGLAKAVNSALLGSAETKEDEENEDSRCDEVHALLRLAPRGSLAIHGLVPGMCKGQPNPVMLNRSQRVADELSKILKKGYAAARKQSDEDQQSNIRENPERWVLQVLLMAPDVAVASLTKCLDIGPGKSFWPNWQTPMGLSKVDITGRMPSSAYRKLMEALECMRIRPEPFKSYAVDLGACPGGWTSVLRKLDCNVVSVDRSKLDPELMNDDMVKFVKGDAFTFSPVTSDSLPSTEDDGVAPENLWMVSDVIAYPERVIELLERWCGGHWARYLIMTMKFQGDKPALDDLDFAISIAESNGYHCRAKHFFNNKNEVTLMIIEKNRSTQPRDLDDNVLGTAMYKPVLP